MSFYMLVKNAIFSLYVNKVRSFLTMVGIIIGISSVVIILSVGVGLQKKVENTTKQTDEETFIVNFTPNNNTYSSDIRPFEKSDFDILKLIDGVSDVTEDISVFQLDSGIISDVQYFNGKSKIMLKQYNNEKLDLLEGRLINDEDNDLSNKVVIITETNAKELFDNNPKNAVGKGIEINGEFFEIIGIVKDSSVAGFSMNYAYIPSELMKSFQSDEPNLSIDVKVKKGYNSKAVFSSIKSELERIHPDLLGEYKMADPQDAIEVFQSIIGGITLFIAIVSGISLFVSGIGVMNIMYVSVTERKREIGIRRALGGKSKVIMAQFLIEAVMITFIGGLAGILLGCISSIVLGYFMPFKPVITVSIVILGSITSIITGIIFGVVPAKKASRLEPINAIYR